MVNRTPASTPLSRHSKIDSNEEQQESRQREEANAALVALLRSWRDDDAEPAAAQPEALMQVMRALDDDRGSGRLLFRNA